MHAFTNRCLLLALTVGAALPGQEAVRLVQDLGDAERGSAAAAALLALGEKAVPTLQDLIEAWQVRQPEDLARMTAALGVVDLLGEKGATLKGPLVDVITGQRDGATKLLVPILNTVGSLTPYGDKVEFHNLFHFSIVASGDDKKESFVAIYRYRERDDAKVADLESARRCLEGDRIFAREVAAEVLGKMGERADAEALRDRLLDRDRRPYGWDKVKHNGFVVPVDDRFALFAGLALVRLAPEDSVSVIGHAMVARHHPHVARRKQALQALARFGPDVEVAVPELMAVATGGEASLAAEALKVLGMAGKSVGQHLRTIDGLEQHPDKLVARLAASLAARLRAMGCETMVVDTAAEREAAQLAALRAAVEALDDDPAHGAAVSAAEQKLAAAPDAAWPLLQERLQRRFQDAPEALVRCIAALGRTRPEADRLEMRGILVMTGDRWSTPFCSSHSGGREMTAAAQEAYGVLTIGAPERLASVIGGLSENNVAVRLAAARLCAQRADEVDANPALREALWQAAVADHPQQSTFDQGDRSSTQVALDRGDDIRAAAAAALRETEQPAERHDELLRWVLRHDAAGAVAAAVKRFGAAGDRADLERAAKDTLRPEVAKAAQEVLAQRAGK